MTRGWQWPVGIAATLLVSAAGSIAFAIVAGRDAAFAVEPDYYAQAVHFDATLAQRAANARLAWRLTPSLALGHTGRAGTLRLAIADAAGAPLAGAHVTVQALHVARAAQVLDATLAESGPGTYEGAVPATRAGLWELRVTVVRGSDRVVDRLRVEASAPPP